MCIIGRKRRNMTDEGVVEPMQGWQRIGKKNENLRYLEYIGYSAESRYAHEWDRSKAVWKRNPEKFKYPKKWEHRIKTRPDNSRRNGSDELSMTWYSDTCSYM